MGNKFQLPYTGEEIDKSLQKANESILFTEQVLTEEQKAQARRNIGVEENEDEEDIAIKEVEFVYDGNREDNTKLFISNEHGHNVYVKVAELPEGKLNLIGSHINVNSSNEWKAYNFTITADMLEKVFEDEWGNVAQATNEGMTQIINMSPGKTVEHTLVIVCAQPGTYTVITESWFETLNFPQKGIYFADFRGVGGQHYIESFTSTYTTGQKVEPNPIKYEGNEIQVFSKGICIGDSITEGVFDYNNTNAPIKQYSYPAALKRMTGIDIVNSGISGTTSQSWREASINSDTFYGRWVNGEWVRTTDTSLGSASLDYSSFDFAIIHLGINDTAQIEQHGSLDAMVNAFETNIKQIISDLKSARRGIKIFLATIVSYRAVDSVYVYESLNGRIKDIANDTDDVYLIDLTAYSECLKGTAYGHGWHLTALGYHKMASEIKSLISYAISQNLNEFKAVQFIGTDYTIE